MDLPQKRLKHFKAGDFIYLHEAIVDVLKLTVSKTGKHGHCGATLFGRNIQTLKNVSWSSAADEMHAYIEPTQHKWIYIQTGEFLDARGSSVLVDSILQWPEVDESTSGDAFSVKRFATPRGDIYAFVKWETGE